MRVPQLGEVVLRRVTGGDAAGQTATLVATAAVGSSFARGLMPPRTVDQATATVLVGAAQYGLLITAQSVAADLARALVGRQAAAFVRPAAQAAVTTTLIAAGAAVERLLKSQPGEPVPRAVVRTMGHRFITSLSYR